MGCRSDYSGVQKARWTGRLEERGRDRGFVFKEERKMKEYKKKFHTESFGMQGCSK